MTQDNSDEEQENDEALNLFAGHETKLGEAVALKVSKAPFKEFANYLQNVHNMLSRATKALCCKDDLEARDKMEAHVRALCETSIHAKHVETCMETALGEVKTAYLQPADSRKRASERFEELMAQPATGPDAVVESQPFFKKFLLATNQKLTRGAGEGGEEEDDIEVLAEEGDESELRRFKCPYTSDIMSNPMRNKACNHVYDASTWTMLLQKRKGCPVRGCPQKHAPLLKANMVEDKDLKMEIEQYLEEQQERQQQKKKPAKKKRKVVLKEDSAEED